MGWFESYYVSTDSFECTLCLYSPACVMFEGEYMSLCLAEKEAYACDLCVCREGEVEFSKNCMMQ